MAIIKRVIPAHFVQEYREVSRVEGRERPACDWIAQRLTGKDRLSSSDAISNGLLDQQTKKLAERALRKGKLNPKMVSQSGTEWPQRGPGATARLCPTRSAADPSSRSEAFFDYFFRASGL